MTLRYGLAAAFAAGIALVLFLRNEGYLHGRVEGGPLTLTGADGLVVVQPRAVAGVDIGLELTGAAVEIERVRPVFASPGLRMLGPRRTEAACPDLCVIARWPPAGTTPLRGSVLDAPAGAALLGLRAPRPGVYYLHHLTALYKRGIKGFRRRSAVDYCVVVRQRPQPPGACAPGYRPPRSTAAVAEAGGPSRYGVPVQDGQARFVARRGRRTLAVTLTNLTGVRRRVTDLRAEAGGTIAVRQVRPARLVLPPHASRRVRLEIAVGGCERDAAVVDALAGRVGEDREEVPLSVPLAFAAPSACR